MIWGKPKSSSQVPVLQTVDAQRKDSSGPRQYPGPPSQYLLHWRSSFTVLFFVPSAQSEKTRLTALFRELRVCNCDDWGKRQKVFQSAKTESVGPSAWMLGKNVIYPGIFSSLQSRATSLKARRLPPSQHDS